MFSFFTFLRCFHFSSFSVFYFSPFSGVFIFHLSQVFPFFTFLRCFIFHLFWVFLCCCTANATDLRELFLFSGVFYLTLLSHICHSTGSATDLREFFLLSGVFYLTVLPDIWHNLFLSMLPWEPAVFLECCRAEL